MVLPRALAIACGYEDCNDPDAPRDDPVWRYRQRAAPPDARLFRERYQEEAS